jgi:ATP-dependent helicase HrpA
MDGLRAAAFEHICAQVFRLEPVLPLTKSKFDAMLEHAHRELPLLVRKVGDLTKQILTLRSKVLQSTKRYPGLETDVQRVVPADFLVQTPPAQLQHIPRYLRAMEVRAERASVSPAKDADKARQLAPLAGWEKSVPAEKREAVRWMIEELRVSTFAQELGTPQSVSVARIKAFAGL